MDEIKKVEATKIVANSAMKQCQRSFAISNSLRNNTVEDNKMDDVIVDGKDKKDDDIIDDMKEKKWLTTRTTSSDENKKVEWTKIVVNAATKWCQRYIDTVEDKVEDKIEDNIVDDVKDKKEDDIVGDVKEKKQVNTKSYSLHRKILVHKDMHFYNNVWQYWS